MIKRIVLLACLLLLTPFLLRAEINNIQNAGFIPGPIWFSKYPVFAEDNIKIYTAIYNNSDYDISGSVYFYFQNEVIGQKEFMMPARSGTRDIWIEWTAQKGDAEISAAIEDVVFKNSDGEELSFGFYENGKIARNKIFIDDDNDKDGLGNIEDEDDDNDGLADLEEIKKGTNPFEPDEGFATSTATSVQEQKTEAQEDGLLDKIDSSVMGFLGNISQNKLDRYIDDFTEEQIEKMEQKKKELTEGMAQNEKQEEQKIETLKSSQDFSEQASGTEFSGSLAEIEKEEAKQKASSFFKKIFSNIYLSFLKVLIFLLAHPFVLFITIFFLIFLFIRKIFRFFIG